MNFNLSEDHQLLSNSLRRYFADNYDLNIRNQYAFSSPYQVPKLWEKLAELGIIGAFIRESHGGYGGTEQDIAVVFEEIGRALCAEPMLGAMLAMRLLENTGQQELLDAMIAGDMRPALAVFEPQIGLDLEYSETSAYQVDDKWRVIGRKTAAYGAPGATHIVIAAKTDTGIGLFLAEQPELIATEMIDGGGVADLILDDLPVRCLGIDCAAIIEDVLDLGRIALCAEAVGAMSHLIDLTIDYMKQRTQFGRPIASFQALQHRVVDMVVDLEQCRSITISAVAAYGTNDQVRKVSMAKNLIGRLGRQVAEEAIQLHGGIGMTWEHPVSHYAKRLVMIDHQLGDHNDHIMRLLHQDAKHTSPESA